MTTTRSSSRPAAAARVAAALGAAALLTLAAPLAASAHVRVNPAQVDPGSYATLTFKVPTESATALAQQLLRLRHQTPRVLALQLVGGGRLLGLGHARALLRLLRLGFARC